jgi:hypothetical protein
MSRSKYLSLITSMRRSPAMHRLAIILPLVMAATTAEAPLSHSATIALSPDAPAAKKDVPAPNWPANPPSMPNEISLIHSGADESIDQSPAGSFNPFDFKKVSSPIELPPTAIPPTSVAIANDPPTAQTPAQFASIGGDDSGLLTSNFSGPSTGISGGGISVSNPLSTIDAGNPGSPSVASPVAVPEPSSILLLPAAMALLRRRRV